MYSNELTQVYVEVLYVGRYWPLFSLPECVPLVGADGMRNTPKAAAPQILDALSCLLTVITRGEERETLASCEEHEAP